MTTVSRDVLIQKFCWHNILKKEIFKKKKDMGKLEVDVPD